MGRISPRMRLLKIKVGSPRGSEELVPKRARLTNALSPQPGARRGKQVDWISPRLARFWWMTPYRVPYITRVPCDAAAGISQDDLCEDTLCSNLQQTIMVASTPKRENASRYFQMRQILISAKVHELSAYETAPNSTCKGMICNTPPSKRR
ncbi:hypothetical protein HPB49_010845 [Dermacentor silvarum]|uniref:Uncharacterized protein n=1 Tax=Dermacentor silvarum TaxID=543639 RepID=A0ACB8DYQ5_DERSI|nr:hypothetical protein HPB49_010845 [Dermacentor silvarum]